MFLDNWDFLKISGHIGGWAFTFQKNIKSWKIFYSNRRAFYPYLIKNCKSNFFYKWGPVNRGWHKIRKKKDSSKWVISNHLRKLKIFKNKTLIAQKHWNNQIITKFSLYGAKFYTISNIVMVEKRHELSTSRDCR